MDEVLQEYVNSSGVELRVDEPGGVLRGVKVLGLASRNGRRYLPSALSQATALYEGAKVNVNHPKGNPLSARDYQDRLGAIRNVSVREDGLFADLHFNPKHALAGQLAWDAAHAPENVGFSHNVTARTTQRDGQTVVEAIVKVQSVDLVADPATTSGLYESVATAGGAESRQEYGEALATVTLEQLGAERPDLIEALDAKWTARVGQLQAELDELHARQAASQRRALAVRLFREAGLPDPDVADGLGSQLVSERVIQRVLMASSETEMRALVREHADLIAAAQRPIGHGSGPRPIAREQWHADRPGVVVTDGESFARAIR